MGTFVYFWTKYEFLYPIYDDFDIYWVEELIFSQTTINQIFIKNHISELSTVCLYWGCLHQSHYREVPRWGVSNGARRNWKSQIREQMSGPEISWYGKSILGCELWPWLVSGKKWSGPILSNFFVCVFQFFMGKKK